jgi:hypothetical protein
MKRLGYYEGTEFIKSKKKMKSLWTFFTQYLSLWKNEVTLPQSDFKFISVNYNGKMR